MGAVSLFSPAEYLAFREVIHIPAGRRREALGRLLAGYGCDEEQIRAFTDIFMKKLSLQGWLLTSPCEQQFEKLQLIYFTITTHCNLACSYCYIGDERRQPDHFMEYRDAAVILDRIRAFNPGARISVTGGEPFTHPDIFRILDKIRDNGFRFNLGSNALLIDEDCAAKLKSYDNLLFIQVSLDGITPATHRITRGDTFEAVMKGLRHLIHAKVKFSLAPTLHEGNLHEIADLARLAYANGGFFSPNHLRVFPHSLNAGQMKLKPESLRKCIIDTIANVQKEYHITTPEFDLPAAGCDDQPGERCKAVCGNASYNVDIDWNGDVYPCHLLREKEFILGNILREEAGGIMARAEHSRTRVRSRNIPKCSKCPFVSTCAGGCRASAYYTKGTLAGEDEFCDILYKFEVDKLFLRKGIHFNMK